MKKLKRTLCGLLECKMVLSFWRTIWQVSLKVKYVLCFLRTCPLVDEAGGAGGPRGPGTPDWEPKAALVGDLLGAPGAEVVAGVMCPCQGPGAGGGRAEEKEWMDPITRLGRLVKDVKMKSPYFRNGECNTDLRQEAEKSRESTLRRSREAGSELGLQV